jgi:hypothetical protein
VFTNALNEDISMHGSNFSRRVFIAVCLLAAIGLFAPTVRAQDKGDADAFESEQAAPVQPSPTLAPPIPSSLSDDTAVVVKSAPAASKTARTGPPAEAGLPGWMSASPSPHVTAGLDWHGNLELDGGYVRYSWNTSDPPEKVYDSRGRFVVGPLLTRDLGNDYFLRITGQVVDWVREVPGVPSAQYQINADDVYVQVGKQGLWDFMAGRFLTWRVFRKGLGFDLYTLEDLGARSVPNFSDPSGRFKHMYEVDTIFMRDSGLVPSGRAAFHLYPTPWSGIELVGSYGRLDGGQNVLGGRLAGGIKPKYFSLLVGAEYEGWSAAQAVAGCDKCGTEKKYGVGGSLAFTPVQAIEIAFSAAYGKDKTWGIVQGAAYSEDTIHSLGGYLQLDVGSLVMPRSLIVGIAPFRTEYRDDGGTNIYQRHDQIAAYVAYPLGFNNSVVKLVFSEAIGYQQPPNPPNVDAHMYSVRLRFAYYY